MVGGGVGGVVGFVQGLKDTSGQTGKLQRTQYVSSSRKNAITKYYIHFFIARLLNYVMKHGARSANTLGTVAVMYSAFGVGLHWLRETEDELNTLAAATTTGLLYKSTSGMKSCLRGGAAGLALGLAYCAFTSKDKMLNWSSN